MTGFLVGLGLLWALVACGFVSAALALRRLDSGRAPKLGASYRVYLLLPRLYGRLVSREGSS